MPKSCRVSKRRSHNTEIMNPRESWEEEQRSAFLYRVCAEAETDARRAQLFLALAGEAEAQAAIWRAQLTALGGGGNLRAAVFGVNDGLVSNSSLILGVAGASPDPHVVLLTGIAGLCAGALAMAAGEYVSVRSQRELFEYQIGLERDELRQY